MIHHFKPAVTSIQACALKRENVTDLKFLLLGHEQVEVVADGSLLVTFDDGVNKIFGARSDPTVWWLLVDSLGDYTITSVDPFENPKLVSAERAR